MFKAWQSPEAVFQIMKRLSAGQPCDITGIAGYEMLERCGGVQWPLSAREVAASSQERDAAEGAPFNTTGSELEGAERRLFAGG